MTHDPSRIRHQVQQLAGLDPVRHGGGTLFTESVLVVNQRDKIIETSNEYDVYDQNGNGLGTVAQVGQSRFAKAVRFLGKNDQFKTVELEVRDPQGAPVLRITRPAKVFKSRVLVQRPDGSDVGEIRQENVFGRISFSILVAQQRIGRITAQNLRARTFTITDHNDVEVAQIIQTWEGLSKALFSTADNYVLRIHELRRDPLASMIVASALTVDTALKQDSRA